MKFIKKLIQKATSAVSRAVNRAKSFAINVLNKVAFTVLYGRATLASAKGEGYVDSGVKILIAVVIGALLLAGLYTLFNSTIMPTVTQKITDLFNYKG
jgi:uncharacterized membrane protein